MAILNPNLKGFYESNYRYYVLYGGRSSSKTYHTAGFCVFLASQYRVKFLCVRQFQNRLEDSVKSTIEEQIEAAGMLDDFNIVNNAITHKVTGSSFAFLGINRNLAEIKGITGVEVLWIEEAEGLTEEQWRIIMPTIRAENSKIFIVFNPRLRSDWVYQNFIVNRQPDSIVRKINYDENPYLSLTMRKVIDAEPRDEVFQHVYLGEPMAASENAIIKPEWILAAVDAHIKLGLIPTGEYRIGFDVADSGDDACCSVEAYGSLITGVTLWQAKEDELLQSATRVYNQAIKNNSRVIYDAIGVGAGVGAKFKELNAVRESEIEATKFLAGGAVMFPEAQYSKSGVKNKDFFSNSKAQAWWLLADRFRNTFNAVMHGEVFTDDQLIFIAMEVEHLDKLVDELSTPLKSFDGAGRVKVESKDDLKKRGIASPNIADALVMATLLDRVKRVVVPVNTLSSYQPSNWMS